MRSRRLRKRRNRQQNVRVAAAAAVLCVCGSSEEIIRMHDSISRVNACATAIYVRCPSLR